MNPKLPLDRQIYTLTVGSVLTTNVFQTISMLAFVQSYSQSDPISMLTLRTSPLSAESASSISCSDLWSD